jgi:hypothetical protein
MAKENAVTEATGNTISEWRQGRIEMTRLVWEHILDPLMTFAEMVRYYDSEEAGPLEKDEISAVLRLLIIGANTDLKVYCSTMATACYTSGAFLEKIIQDWDK